MKRFAVPLLTVALVLSAVAIASAYFDEDHLNMFYYNEETATEVGYDFGLLSDLDFTTTTWSEIAPAGTFDWLGDTGTDAANANDVKVGFYSGNGTTYKAWIGSTLDVAPEINVSQAGGFWSGITSIAAEYDTQKAVGTYGALGSYGQAMNANGSGSYAALNNNPIFGEITLADALSGDYIYLYAFEYDGGAPGLPLVEGCSGPYQAAIRLNENGSVEMNSVPVPGAVWLLGSALVGLFGIRRKKA